MIVIGGKTYVLDLDSVYDFINFSSTHDSKEKEVVTSYVEGKVDEKSVRELTTPGNSQIDNIKYDLVKMLIIQVLTYDEKQVDSLDNMPFGTQLAFLTLINEGFLVLVEEQE